MDQIPLDQVPEGARARVEGIIREAIELDSQNQSTEALQILTVLVAEFPRTAVAHSYLAWILSRVGQHRKAIQHGRVAVQLSPDSEKISLLFFRVLWSAQKYLPTFDEMKRFSAYGHSEKYVLMMQTWKSAQ